MRLKVRSLTEEELQFDRDAAAMAGIDPDTGRFISEDRGSDDKNGEDRKSASEADVVLSSDGSAFTEEDARAFAEGKAYQIRQATGKHYSRSMSKASGQERR
jgi:hypothetical protein